MWDVLNLEQASESGITCNQSGFRILIQMESGDIWQKVS
jgi:hypothetical protein